MFLCFCIIVYILGVISAFVRYTQNITCSAFGKKYSKNQHFGWIPKKSFSPTILYDYGCCFWWFYIQFQAPSCLHWGNHHMYFRDFTSLGLSAFAHLLTVFIIKINDPFSSTYCCFGSVHITFAIRGEWSYVTTGKGFINF
jgi:hypothetical protein